jgi:DNA-binding CsgD family transcriptional regulator
MDEIILSEKQISIIQWIADGKRNIDICGLMELTNAVLQSAICSAMDSTGSNSRSALVAYAFRKGLIK